MGDREGTDPIPEWGGGLMAHHGQAGVSMEELGITETTGDPLLDMLIRDVAHPHGNTKRLSYSVEVLQDIAERWRAALTKSQL